MGSLTNFPNGLTSFGIPVLGGASPIPFTGNYFFVDVINGNDGNTGKSPAKAYATLTQAYSKCSSGNNDVVFIIGNGAASGSQRLSSSLTWAKDATHLIGITAPTGVAQRARIAPTAAVTAFTPMVTVTGSGCYFANFSVFHGFNTGTTSQICWIDQGSRNCYVNVAFEGMGDTASAQSTGSRSLVIGSGGNGEHTFFRCTIGLDTVARTVANASLELTGGTPRNSFIECTFPFQTSAATPLGIYAAAASAIDRWTKFERCVFINNTKSGSTTMTALTTMAASAGGMVILKDCTAIGITDLFSDANTSGQMFIDGAAPTSTTTGLGIAPA